MPESLLKPGLIEPRDYQRAIVETALRKNTLVLLPTALGKTVIALGVAARRAEETGGKVLVLAPTRPLCLQHMETFRKHLAAEGAEFALLLGSVPTGKREEMFRRSRFIFATPQTVRNDLETGRYDLREVCLLVFDEAHRARKKYAYGGIAARYRGESRWPRVLALTASPGKDRATIEATCADLGMEAIEHRDETSPDVKPYVPPLDLRWLETSLPEPYRAVRALLEEMRAEPVAALQKAGLLPRKRPDRVNRSDLLSLGRKLRKDIEERPSSSGLYEALVAQSAALSLSHAIEVLTTQDIRALEEFLADLETKTTRTARWIRSHPRFREVADRARAHRGLEHPKVALLSGVLADALARNPESRAIVFTQYRSTAARLLERFGSVPGLRPARFVGQASREGDAGLSQQAQAEVLRRFREGDLNLLIATSVAEEGLDVPSVDLVVFYEPVPSEIRAIQRRGRTARRSYGRAVILVARGTVDEAYLWAARSREARMRRAVSGFGSGDRGSSRQAKLISG
ncbi:MAG: helicase-related protein [Halobacteria archaeon]